MNGLIVYESMHGKTARIAAAIGAALREQVPVDVKAIGEFDQLPPDLDLLVVGGPTYAHGVEAAMKAFRDRLPGGSLEGIMAAAFDTRLDWPKVLSGAASKGIAARLQGKGARLALSSPNPQGWVHKAYLQFSAFPSLNGPVGSIDPTGPVSFPPGIVTPLQCQAMRAYWACNEVSVS